MLIADLASADAVTRDGAVARLIVIGERAVPRLLAVASDRAAQADSRASAFHALEGIGDTRAFDPAIAALSEAGETVAVAAVGVMRAFLGSARGVDALDRLTAIALDRARPRSFRLAAIRAVGDLGATTIAPLYRALQSDADPAIVLAAGLGTDAGTDAATVLRQAAAGTLPDSPGALRLAVTEAGARAPIAELALLIERVRYREGAEPGPARAEWVAVRAAAHLLLAERGSRSALYDLRETFETAREALPVEFLGAAAAIGDSAMLEAVATACGRAIDAGMRVDDWWIRRLTDVFRAIAAREHLTRRHGVAKRIAARSREAAALLWP
jgi:hypothetical protein